MSYEQLLAILKTAKAERAYWANQRPLACPIDGTVLTPSPPGHDSELFCSFDGWQYPRDWTRLE